MPPINTTNPNPAPKPNRGHRGAPQITTGHRSPDQMDVRMGMATTDGRERDQPAHDPSQIPDLSRINPRHLEPVTHIEQRIRQAENGVKGIVFKFRSRNRFHTVLLEAFPDRMMGNGRVEKGRTVLAKFKDGEYWTENPEHARFLIGNKGGYGLHLDYWDAEEEDNAAALAQYNSFKAAVKGSPELYQRFMQDMAAGDFDEVIASDDYDGGGQPVPKVVQDATKPPAIPALEGQGEGGDLLREDA